MRTLKSLSLAVLVTLVVGALGGCDDGDSHKITIKTKPGEIDVKTK